MTSFHEQEYRKAQSEIEELKISLYEALKSNAELRTLIEQFMKEENKKLKKIICELWHIIDDIDTYSDMTKADDKFYRHLTERKQRERFDRTGIVTDGYNIFLDGENLENDESFVSTGSEVETPAEDSNNLPEQKLDGADV